MKKILLTLITVFTVNVAINAQAENYGAFKVDVMLGYANPSSSTDAVKGGLTFSIEPKYNLTDNIAVGLQLGSTILTSSNSAIGISALGNYSLTGEYYLTDNKVRPFAGLGAGLYTFGDIEITSGGQTTKIPGGDSQFGFAPRAGLQIGHFRIAAEYNLVKDSNFLALKIGATIGGGAR
jgi:outer membrane protein W